MPKWKCPTDDESTPFLDAVARTMVTFFGIGEDEAIARINYHWGHLSFLSEDEKGVVANRDPDEWARLIYFDRLRVTEGEPEPLPRTLNFTEQPVTSWEIDGNSLSISLGSTVWGDPVRSAFEIHIGPFSGVRGQRKPLGEPARAITDLSEPVVEINEFGFGPPAWLKGFGATSGDWLHYEFNGPVRVV